MTFNITLNGHTIRVTIARPRKRRGGRVYHIPYFNYFTKW